jgi:hypothetical protein
MRIKKIRNAFGLACAIGATLPLAAFAQTPAQDTSVQELQRKLEQSLQRIDELSRRVRQLEDAQPHGTSAPAAVAATTTTPAAAGAAPAVAAAPASDQRVEELGSQVRQLSQSLGRMDTNTGVPLHGFIDVGARFYSRTDPNSTNSANGFSEKAIDFYLNPSLGQRIRSLMEIAIETSERDQSVGIDMERLQVGYVVNDALTVWTGRFHTPYGYWNTAFHHGPQIQTSIQRPKFLAFEDTYGMMPAHTVGIWGTGRQSLGDGHLTYDFTVGNSPRILTDNGQPGTGQVDMNLLGSNNHDMSTLANIGYEFGGSLDGLKLGIHAMRWKTTDDVAPSPNSTNVRFVGGYGAYTENDWELLGEYYHFSVFWHFTPYVRWEAAVLDQADNYFGNLSAPIGSSYRRYAGGLRYDLTSNTALKFEYDRTHYFDRGLDSYNEYRAQVAVRF